MSQEEKIKELEAKIDQALEMLKQILEQMPRDPEMS